MSLKKKVFLSVACFVLAFVVMVAVKAVMCAYGMESVWHSDVSTGLRHITFFFVGMMIAEEIIMA